MSNEDNLPSPSVYCPSRFEPYWLSWRTERRRRGDRLDHGRPACGVRSFQSPIAIASIGGSVHMNKARRSIVAIGLFFAVCNVALKVIGNLLDGKAIELNMSVTWTAVFWFCVGLLIGYLVSKTPPR